MLKAQKRLTKKKLKEDKFVTFYFQAQEYFRQYSKHILYGIGGAVALWVAFFIISQKQFKNEQAAAVELTKAQLKYFNNDYLAAIPVLKNLVEQYGSTNSGIIGKYYLGNAIFQQHRYDESVRYFNEYIADGGDNILCSSSIAGVAACMEEQKKYLTAAQKYEEAARTYSTSFMVPDQLYKSARCYALAGEKNKAAPLLTEVIEKYSTASIKNDAEILLAELALKI